MEKDESIQIFWVAIMTITRRVCGRRKLEKRFPLLERSAGVRGVGTCSPYDGISKLLAQHWALGGIAVVTGQCAEARTFSGGLEIGRARNLPKIFNLQVYS